MVKIDRASLALAHGTRGSSTTCRSYCVPVVVILAVLGLGSIYLQEDDPSSGLGDMTKAFLSGSSMGDSSSGMQVFSKADESEAPQNQQCRFFMAESAIPYGGLGVFTVRDIPKRGMAQPGSDICIHVVNPPVKMTTFGSHSWAGSIINGIFEGQCPSTHTRKKKGTFYLCREFGALNANSFGDVDLLYDFFIFLLYTGPEA